MPCVTPSLNARRPPAGSSPDRPGRARSCWRRPRRRSRAAQAGRRRTAPSAAAPRRRRALMENPPCVLSSRPASSGVSRMPSRLEAVAAHSAAGTLPRAIEVKAIEDCTVDGSTHSSSRPVHSGGVSRPGATARAARPSAGNSRKVLSEDHDMQPPVACSGQRRLRLEPRTVQEEQQRDGRIGGVAGANGAAAARRQQRGERRPSPTIARMYGSIGSRDSSLLHGDLVDGACAVPGLDIARGGVIVKYACRMLIVIMICDKRRRADARPGAAG